MRLEGKVALLSGGARGQGTAEATLMAQEGAKVVVGDILDDEGMKVEAEIRELGGEATYVHLDVTKEDDWIKAVELTESRYGKLNVLVNNADISLGEQVPVHDSSLSARSPPLSGPRLAAWRIPPLRTGTASWTSTPRECFWALNMPFLPCGGPLEAPS